MTVKARRLLPFSHILLILMGILVLYLVVDFGRQVGLSHQRREELRQIEKRIEAANAETAELKRRLEFASSPQAAEAWARRNGLTRDDEVLVVFLGSLEDSSPAEEQELEAGMVQDSPRDAWWDLFFGAH